MHINAHANATELTSQKKINLTGVFSSILAKLNLWHSIMCQRAILRDASDHLLKDIGMSRADALREASRPFWDVGAQNELRMM